MNVDFAPGSFLSLYEAGSFGRLADRVLEFESNPDLYELYRRANPFRTGEAAQALESYDSGLAMFLRRVADDVRQHPGRRYRSRLGGAIARGGASKRQLVLRSKKLATRRRGG